MLSISKESFFDYLILLNFGTPTIDKKLEFLLCYQPDL